MLQKFVLLVALLFSLSSTGFSQWTELQSGTTQDLIEIFFPVADTGYVIGHAGTVLKTTDGGLIWNNISPGIPQNLHDVYFLSSEEGWIVGDSGSICSTVNGGATWTCSYLDSAMYINLHAVYAFNRDEILIGGQNFSSNGYIATTNNGGAVWESSYIESYFWDIDITKIGMVNDNVGYAITRGNVLKTTDSGANWFITDTASVHAGDMFSIMEDLAVFPNNDTIYACGWYNGYFGSTINGGQKWQHESDYQCYTMDFLDARTGYIGGWGQVHKTIDGGATFINASGGDDFLFSYIYSIDFTDEWTGYACGHEGIILKTINGGSTAIKGADSNEDGILLFPNPVRDIVYFQDAHNVKLVNGAGSVLTEKVNVSYLDISNYPAGVYSLMFTNAEGQIIQHSRIIKE